MANYNFVRENIQDVEKALNSVSVVGNAGLVFCKRRNYIDVQSILKTYGYERTEYEDGRVYEHRIFGVSYTVILERN